MSYYTALLYNVEGAFLGYAIMGPDKLQATHVYHDPEELQGRINELNQAQDLRKFWPHPQDPEVLELLDREDFEPLEMTTVAVVDMENSPKIVYKQVASTTPQDGWGERWVDSDEIDEAASDLVYKNVEVPLRPSDRIARVRAACETIAKARADLTK